jgi:molecular chaperone GrpE (heat shock protein)
MTGDRMDFPGRPRLLRWTYSSRMERELEALGDKLETLASHVAGWPLAREEDLEAWNALQQRLDRMEKQIQRAGKEQFRTNALTESTQQKLGTVLETIQVLDEARNRELEQAREALKDARTAGRVAFFTRLLPAMDSLEEALAAGRRQLAGWIQEPVRDAPQPLPLAKRLGFAWKLLRGTWIPWEAAASPRERLRPESLASWLTGLELLRERLLEQFAQEGIRPMVTVGELFDPQLHLACKTVPASAHRSGTIVEEARAGYQMEDTVLRYAEVVVAK